MVEPCDVVVEACVVVVDLAVVVVGFAVVVVGLTVVVVGCVGMTTACVVVVVRSCTVGAEELTTSMAVEPGVVGTVGVVFGAVVVPPTATGEVGAAR